MPRGRPRKIAASDVAAETPTAGVVLQAETTSGPVGVFPQPRPETVVRPPDPVRTEQPSAVFLGNGQYLKRVDGKIVDIRFRGGEYKAVGQPMIDVCRSIGFPERVA